MDDYRLISETIFYKSAFTHSMGGNQSQIITITDLPDQLFHLPVTKIFGRNMPAGYEKIYQNGHTSQN